MNYEKLAAVAFKDGKTENLTPTYVEWKTAGQVIVGEYRNKAEVDSTKNKGTYFQYMFQTDNGLIKFHLGKATDGEAGCTFEPGNIYHIEYQGQLKLQGGNTVNKFHIERIIIMKVQKEE